MQFYTKDESGEFVEATDSQIEDLFKEKSAKIVAKKLATAREKEMERLRPEIEEKVRKEAMETLAQEARAAARDEMKGRLGELEKAKDDAETKLRRKTIAAEYGFKPEAEEFLGSGTEDEMRAKADALKSSFAQPSTTDFPEKKGADAPDEMGAVRLLDNND